MKVLYLGKPPSLQSQDDYLVAALGDRYPIAFYDPARPVAEQFEGVDVVIDPGGAMGTRAMIDAALATGVRLWQVTTTGLDHVDVAYFLERGMPLANTPGQFSATALAEHALFLMLSFAKNIHLAQKNVRSRVFGRPMNEELAGTTLGLVGLGASGRALAERAWAMGMRIMAVDIADVPQALLDELHVEFFGTPSQLARVAAEADYLSIHVPLTSRTRNMIDRYVFDLMKPSAVLINVARGEIVEEAALIEALQSGRIRGAGLDVFAHEPLDPQHPLLQMDNVLATPHIAGVTTGTMRRRAQAAAENVARIAQGFAPLYLVTALE